MAEGNGWRLKIIWRKQSSFILWRNYWTLVFFYYWHSWHLTKIYWSNLKTKLTYDEGFSQLYKKIVQLKLIASDGKRRKTDCADVETLLRIIQSIPSKKAEPVKQRLVKVGYERMKEMADPTSAIDRARETFKKSGWSDKWIPQRMTGQETWNKLTDYWKDHEITEGE